MNAEDIIRMAREAGAGIGSSGRWLVTQDELERFAALIASRVAAHIRETEFKPDWNNYRQGFADGVAEEREACAEICDRFQARDVGMQPAECAGAIRARGKTTSRGNT